MAASAVHTMSERAQTTVLFVDVSGSTRLYENSGDTVAYGAISACINILKQRTQANGGRVIKTIGDEVMSVFPAASAAANAAVEMQEAIDKLPPFADSKIGVRIGLHYGPVVERDDDVFGDTVNLAARLAGFAAKGQIMTSVGTIEQMTPAQRAWTRRLYSIPVKGKAQEVRLHEILWRDSGETTTLVAQQATTKHQQTTLRLMYLDREIVLDGARNTLTLGRDKDAGLTVIDRMASRSHGRIDCRFGKFVYADQSANSTYITIDGEPEFVLRRDEIILRGRGFIAFGQSRTTASEVAEFVCE